MNTEMEKLYNLIGQSVADSLPKGWENAQVSIALQKGVITVQAFYWLEQEKEQHSFEPDFAAIRHFKTLHEIMSKTTKGDWKSAKFEINREGHFDFSFEYE